MRGKFLAAALFLLIPLVYGRPLWAQVVPSLTESLLVVPVAAPKVPGSTFNLTIGLANERYIGGMSGRIVFDTNIIAPQIVIDQVTQLPVVPATPIGRAANFAFPDSGAVLAAPRGPGAVGFVMFSSVPQAKIYPGSGPVLQLAFTVRTSSDTTICIRFEDDPVDTGLENGLSDTLGNLILPSLGRGSVRIGAGSATGGCGPGVPGPGNDPPIINPIPPRSVPQGSVLSFSVTASDPDGDNVTLSATTLPQNATFNTVTGDSVVSGTFTFAPSLSQAGNFTVVFRAADDSAAVTQSTSITVTEVLQDVLFSSSVTGKAPTGAIPGKGPVFFPIDLTVRDKVFGLQFDLAFDTGVIVLDSIIPTGRLANFVLESRNLNNQPDRVRVLAFSLSGDSVLPAPLPTIMNLALSVSPLAQPGKTNIVIDSGWEVVRVGGPSVPLLTESGEFFIDRFGDANGDSRIDVADVVAIVGYILGNYAFSVRQFDAANTDQDSLVNIIDLVNTINLIFGVPLPPPAPRYAGPPAQLALNARPFAFNPAEPIRVEAELPTDVAGVQVHISYNPSELNLEDPQKTFATKELTLHHLDRSTAGKMSFVLYNMGAPENEIPAGRNTILNIPATRLSGIGDTIPPKLTITRAFLSTGGGQGVPVAGVGANVPRQFELSQNYPNPFNPKTTIQFKVAAADGDGSPVPVKLEVFNILGQSVKTLVDERRAPGSYTLEWDGTDASGRRVSSGIYLYRLTSKDFAVTKKMVFLK